MSHPTVETLILGAGPGGLACAHALSRKGRPVTVIERADQPGGLMRSIVHGDFRVDLGRKELYSRIPEVDSLWHEMLGEDYRIYPHREGILYGDHVIETSSESKRLRGIPFSLLLRSSFDLIHARLRALVRPPRNYEEFWYTRRGRTLSRILSQGYDEKFNGRRWAEMPVPDQGLAGNRSRGKPTRKIEWRHPALGSGQIVDELVDRIRTSGGRLLLGATVSKLELRRDEIAAVHVHQGDDVLVFEPRHVISSLGAPILSELLGQKEAPLGNEARIPNRGVVLVYLFANAPSQFPHNWLRVTCPKRKVGRIVNYATYGGRMVPKEHSCVCMEYFCIDDDDLYALTHAELVDLARRESRGLFASEAESGSLVLKLPMSDAASSWRDWESPSRKRLRDEVEAIGNLLDIGRPGTDKAMAAGIFAANAVLANDLMQFGERIQAIDGALTTG